MLELEKEKEPTLETSRVWLKANKNFLHQKSVRCLYTDFLTKLGQKTLIQSKTAKLLH